MSTVFSVEKSLFSSGTMAFQGDVGYGNGSPNAVLRASYSHTMPNGSKPEMAFTMRRLAAPGLDSRTSALQALALSASDEFTFGRRSGTSLWQRIANYPVHGTGDGVPSVWIRRSASFTQYRPGVPLRNFAAGQPDGKRFRFGAGGFERVRPARQPGGFYVDAGAGSSS